MNTDLIRDDFPLIPTGLIETDALALEAYITMYSLAVENLDDVNEASERIAEELDMEGHMKAFQERTEAFQEFLM